MGWNRQLRLTPLSARQLPARQGAHRLPDGHASASSCSTPPASALGVRHAGGPVDRDDGADPGGADPVRGDGHRHRPPAHAWSRWGRRSAASRRCSPSSAAPGSRSRAAAVFVRPGARPAVLLAGPGGARGARRRRVGRARAGWSSRSGRWPWRSPRPGRTGATRAGSNLQDRRCRRDGRSARATSGGRRRSSAASQDRRGRGRLEARSLFPGDLAGLPAPDRGRRRTRYSERRRRGGRLRADRRSSRASYLLAIHVGSDEPDAATGGSSARWSC